MQTNILGLRKGTGMAELTAEIVRNIVKEEVKREVKDEVGGLRAEMCDLRAEMHEGFAAIRSEMREGFEMVINAMQHLNDEDRDQIAGINGRLHSHNERISRLERLKGLRT